MLFLLWLSNDVERGLFFPKGGIFFAILQIGFRFNESQGFLPDAFVGYNMIYIMHTLKDVVADHGAVLFTDALVKTAFEALHQQLLLFLTDHADFPQRLHAMTGRHKAIILGHI